MIVTATDLRIVFTTAGTRDEGDRIARTLVDRNLAACVNVVPGLASVYRWQGDVQSANEVLLVIKTSADRLESLESALHSLHSYDLPEFLVLHPNSSSAGYRDWILQCTASPPE